MSTQTLVTKAAVPRCIDAFYRAYVRTFNPPDLAEAWLADMAHKGYRTRPRSVPAEHMTLPLIAGGKDAGLMRQMIDAWGEAHVLALIEKYFAHWQMRDWRVVRTNANIGGLRAVASYLQVCDDMPSSPRTADNLNAAARAMQSRETGQEES